MLYCSVGGKGERGKGNRESGKWGLGRGTDARCKDGSLLPGGFKTWVELVR